MCAVTPPVRSRLPMDTRAPARARALLDQAACGAHRAGVLGHARLLVSELVTNAVRHGAAPVTIEFECDESAGMLVRVADEGPTRPVLRRSLRDDGGQDGQPAGDGPGGGAGGGGRGLALVDLVSDEWGVEPVEHGKVVWFRLGPPGRGHQ